MESAQRTFSLGSQLSSGIRPGGREERGRVELRQGGGDERRRGGREEYRQGGREELRGEGREQHRREGRKKDLLLSLIGYLCEKN